MKLNAIGYGEDGFAGDSPSCPSVDWLLEADEASTYEELLAAWQKRAATEIGGVEQPDGSFTFEDADGADWNMAGDELAEYLKEQADEGSFSDGWPVGFWLLTDKDWDTVCVPGEIECFTDDQNYTTIRCMKMLCAHLAVKTVGSPVPEDG